MKQVIFLSYFLFLKILDSFEEDLPSFENDSYQQQSYTQHSRTSSHTSNEVRNLSWKLGRSSGHITETLQYATSYLTI